MSNVRGFQTLEYGEMCNIEGGNGFVAVGAGATGGGVGGFLGAVGKGAKKGLLGGAKGALIGGIVGGVVYLIWR